MTGAEIFSFPGNNAGNELNPLNFFYPQLEHEVTFCHDARALAQLSLANKLHQQLEVAALLDVFVNESVTRHPVNGIAFCIPDTHEMLLSGQDSGTIVKYRLRHNNQTLGDFEIFSDAPYRLQLDELFAPLGAPLSNALSHYRLQQLARRDPLTRLGNRFGYESGVATELSRAQRYGHAFSMLVIDIDHFKHINDRFGHCTGDRVIRSVAEQILDCLRPYDQAFRYGGEEFVILLGQTGTQEAMQTAERVRRSIETKVRVNQDPARRITVSIGIAENTTEIASAEALFERADRALYDAKGAGRNCVVVAA